MLGSLRLGPVFVQPSIRVSDAGIDSNVFHDDVNPREDVTFRAIPGAQFHVRMGRGQAVGTLQAVVEYFQRYEDQRSAYPAAGVRVDWPSNRISASVFGMYARSQDRPNLEIDLRARRTLTEAGGSADVHLSARTGIRLEASRSTTIYDPRATADGTNLAEALNRRSDVAAVSLRYAMTPLTTGILRGEWTLDSFEVPRTRRIRGLRVTSGLDLHRSALVSGTASVGYRRLVAAGASGPAFEGLTMQIGVSTVARGTTRLSLNAARDAEYSLDIRREVLSSTTLTAAVTQRVSTGWEVIGSAIWERMVSRPQIPGDPTLAVSPAMLTLRGTAYRVGMLRVLPLGLRFGIEAGTGTRDASVERDFKRWYVGGSLTYGT